MEEDGRLKYTLKQRMRVMQLYLENVGIRSIERLENIPNPLIIKWIKAFGRSIKAELNKIISSYADIPDNIKKGNITLLECDEIVTFVKKNSKTKENIPTFGLLLIGTKIALLTLK
jgi:predicted metal-dependent peptidase